MPGKDMALRFLPYLPRALPSEDRSLGNSGTVKERRRPQWERCRERGQKAPRNHENRLAPKPYKKNLTGSTGTRTSGTA